MMSLTGVRYEFVNQRQMRIYVHRFVSLFVYSAQYVSRYDHAYF